MGNIFYGSEGYMVIKGYSKYEMYLGQKKEPGPTGDKNRTTSGTSSRRFAKRDNSDQNGPVETAHLSALAHLGNIATGWAGFGIRSRNGEVRRRQRGQWYAHAPLPQALRRPGKSLASDSLFDSGVKQFRSVCLRQPL